jgi:hypothetical protein
VSLTVHGTKEVVVDNVTHGLVRPPLVTLNSVCRRRADKSPSSARAPTKCLTSLAGLLDEPGVKAP